MPEESQSDYPQLKLPQDGWKSNIPEHLLTNAEPEIAWLMQEMSKNTQATEWNSRAALDTNNQVRKTNGRLKNAEHKVEVMEAEIISLKSQMAVVNPIVNTISTLKVVFTNKLFLVILGTSILFLLGFNRDVLPVIWKFFFG